MITGVESPLGRRVARLAAEEEDADVVGLAGGPVAGLPARVAVYRVDLSGDDVKPHLQDADVLVHLATSVPATPTAVTDGSSTPSTRFIASRLSVIAIASTWRNTPTVLCTDAVARSWLNSATHSRTN